MQPYISLIEFNPEPSHCIVVCCSDGRTRDQVTDFLSHLGIDADIYAVPGGPLIFGGGVEFFSDSNIAQKRIEFLADEHDAERIILITHGSDDEDAQCGMMKHIYPNITPDERLKRQLTMLKTAEKKVAGFTGLPVESYFASVIGDMVQFEKVE
ncbi:MAG: hypothetical protein ACYC27_02090 [Armatimonadota bacterium]